MSDTKITEFWREALPFATHRDKVPDTGPETVIWQLPPATCIFYIPVVKYTSRKVDDNGNHNNDTKDTSRAHASWLVRLDASTRMLGAHDEQIGAFIRVGANKRDGSCRADRVAVASEGEGSGLSAEIVFLDGHGIERAGVAFAVGTAQRGRVTGCG